MQTIVLISVLLIVLLLWFNKKTPTPETPPQVLPPVDPSTQMPVDEKAMVTVIPN